MPLGAFRAMRNGGDMSRSLLISALALAGCAFGDDAEREVEQGASVERIAEIVRVYSEARGFNGVVLVETPELRYEVAIGLATATPKTPLEPGAIFELASLSKLYLATAVIHAAEHGAFIVDGVDRGLDAPISRFLPDRADHGYPHANLRWWDGSTPIRQLLQHSAGIPPLPQWVCGAPVAFTAWDLVHLVNASPLVSVPGQVYAYSNAGFTVAEVVLETATGVPYAEYLRAHILDPLGLVDTGCRWTPAHRARRAAPVFDVGPYRVVDHEDFLPVPPRLATAACGMGGVHASAADVAKLARALRRGEIVAAFSEMRTPGVVPGYGLGTMISTLPTTGTGTWIGHNGASRYRTSLLSNPEEDQTVVVLSNGNPTDNIDFITSALAPTATAMNVSLVRALDGLPPNLPAFPTVDDAALAAYAGDYCAFGERYEVRTADAQLGVGDGDHALLVRRQRQWSFPIAAPLTPIVHSALPGGTGFVPATWARAPLSLTPPYDVNAFAFASDTLFVVHENTAVLQLPRFQWWMIWCW